jgi:ATP-dependent Zn protease
MMGIERKSLSMSEKDRLHTAIHESGHAITCYFNKNAQKLYKATIVARGGSLGAVSTHLKCLMQNLDLYGARRNSRIKHE